jgi:FLVCR family feline leukemia virus subgroup C receptor-related protein
LVTLGSIGAAFGQVFFINSSSKIATTWFGDKERSLSTALGGLALPIGCIVGFVIPAFMISDSDALLPKEDGKMKFRQYLFVQNVITTIGTVPLLVFVREKPPTPPSASASLKEQPLQFGKEMKLLCANRSYLLLCVAFTSLYGVYTLLGAVVAAITKPYEYTGIDNAILGGTFIFFGVFGSFILSVLVDKTMRFKLIINIISLSACGFVSLTYFTLPSKNVALFAVNLAFIGFCIIPIIPISYSFAVELTFPTPEAMSNGMMILPS